MFVKNERSRFDMRDRLTKERRSWNMSRIRGKDTTPEKLVRSVLHRLGYRFRLHGKKLPGRPDIVLAKHKTVIFVHGCFWHRHRGWKNCTTPTTNRKFWIEKLEGNAARDKVHQRVLSKLGWRTVGCGKQEEVRSIQTGVALRDVSATTHREKNS
jgi:DNA mismatch endonuclease, patch repair protein